MPEKDGKLSDSEKRQILDWLTERSKWPGADHRCPICGRNEWEIADHVVQPVTHASDSVLLGGPAYPQVMVVSPGCGYTRYFNAIVMKILKAELETDSKPAES